MYDYVTYFPHFILQHKHFPCGIVNSLKTLFKFAYPVSCFLKHLYVFQIFYNNNQYCNSQFFNLFWFLFVLALPRGTWDHNSSTRDQTCVPCIGSAES